MSTTSKPQPSNEKSGKLLILGVLVAGLVAAAASWWFRYSTTHRAAQFWGPQAATLIRDAPHVTLRSDASTDVPRDVSSMPGLSNFRAALVDDRNYDWSAARPTDLNWTSSLVFEESAGGEPRAVVLFSPDFHWVANGSSGDPAHHAASTSPMAAGLKKFFTEQSPDAPAQR